MASLQVEYVQNVVETCDLYLCVEILLLTRSTVILLNFTGECSSSMEQREKTVLVILGQIDKNQKILL